MNEPSRLKLLIISYSELKADARLLKQIELLRESYEVTTCGYGEAPNGVETHVQLSAEHPIWAYDRISLITRQYNRAYWANPAITDAMKLLAGREFDLVLANDVDPVGVALKLRPRLGVHVDLHEYSPRQKEDVPRWRLFVAPFIHWMVRNFVAKASSWSTVSSGLAHEYQRVFGFEPEVITNASPFHDYAPQLTQTPIKLVHSGAAIRDRKLETMIEAVHQSGNNVTLDLFLTHNDPGYVAELRASVDGNPDIIVHDPVPYAELIQELHKYDLGIFLLEPTNFSYRYALPNKIFDFIQARLGIIVGPSPEMETLVRQYSLGLVTEDFRPASLTTELDHVTPYQVDEWKAASDRIAHVLSSEQESTKWLVALRRLETI